ncbi:MAG TPA: ABC transporter ATP-binding protein [Reyranella sp.]|jgi:NitT/TauT family transport system ATP-binding protein
MVALAVRDAAADAAFGAALDINGVDHGFVLHGEYLPVLSDVSLSAAPGEFVALLGPSGCGKSTLLRLVAGLDRPRQGSLRVDGVEVTGPDPSRVVVFQDPTLYPWRTVWHNASLGLETRGLLRQQRHRVDEALALVGLAPFAKAYPHQLSGGMAQRASLARALVNDPSLLILDEPLGKLDSLTRLAMQGELTRLWQARGFTVLMVTHDVEEALLLANRVIVFSDRPARIRADLAVDLPYPRHRDHPELLRLRREALELLGLARDW